MAKIVVEVTLSMEHPQLREKHHPIGGRHMEATCLWLAGNEGLEKKMETTMMAFTGTTIRIHSFIPS